MKYALQAHVSEDEIVSEEEDEPAAKKAKGRKPAAEKVCCLTAIFLPDVPHGEHSLVSRVESGLVTLFCMV